MSLINRLLERPERREATLSQLLASLRDGRAPSNSSFSAAGTHQALRMSAVWACTRVLSETVAQMPWHAYRVDASGGDTRVKLDPQPSLVREPSAQVTKPEWTGQVIAGVVTSGNTIGVVTARDRLMRATSIELQQPDRVVMRQKRPGAPLEYMVGGTAVDRADIFHVRGFTLPGMAWGLNPIAHARVSIELGLQAEGYGASWFREGGHPTGVLKSDQKLDPGQADLIKKRFLAAVQGAGIAALGSGFEYQAVQSSPQDAQFLETQKWTVLQVAKFFGVPPELIGAAPDGSSVTYANREQRLLDFLMIGLQPWIIRLESQLTRQLPAGQMIKLNADALLRSDTLTRYKAHSMAIRDGWRSPNETRRLEDEPPIPDGDIYLWPPGKNTDPNAKPASDEGGES